MRRTLAVLAGLALSLCMAPTPAHAIGTGACTITGTIRFTPNATTPGQGVWDIDPAVIQCRGMFNFISTPRGEYGIGEQFVGPGSRFTGSGSYRTVPSGDKGCLHELGAGNVEYWFQTQNQDVHMIEKNTFVAAGAGAFTTPTLYGSFQVPLHESECLDGPPTTALFLAEVAMVRTSGIW